MRIVAAAIRANGLVMSMPRPARHCHIMAAMPARMARAVRPDDQGFLTDTGEFLGREQALDVARHAKQLKREVNSFELYSEDLW